MLIILFIFLYGHTSPSSARENVYYLISFLATIIICLIEWSYVREVLKNDPLCVSNMLGRPLAKTQSYFKNSSWMIVGNSFLFLSLHQSSEHSSW